MMNRIKYRWKRLLVLWRQWESSINNQLNNEKIVIQPYEEKAIKLWKICLKDPSSNLAYNTSGVRHIEKEDLLIILQPSGNIYYIMTIMDVNSSNKTLFEVHIPKKESEEICEWFDNELEKRMKKVESNKRNIIENDIDKLLVQEQNKVKKQLVK